MFTGYPTTFLHVNFLLLLPVVQKLKQYLRNFSSPIPKTLLYILQNSFHADALWIIYWKSTFCNTEGVLTRNAEGGGGGGWKCFSFTGSRNQHFLTDCISNLLVCCSTVYLHFRNNAFGGCLKQQSVINWISNCHPISFLPSGFSNDSLLISLDFHTSYRFLYGLSENKFRRVFILHLMATYG